jgi:hypothetical protein
MPAARMSPITRQMSATISGARPSVASSRMISSGWVISARPIDSICCSPPDSCAPRLPSRSARRGKVASTVRRSSPAGRRGRGARPSPGSRARSGWGTHRGPRARRPRPGAPSRAACARDMSWPNRWIWPSRCATWPSRLRISVLLPMPLRPSRPTVSPRAICRSTPCSTWLLPYQAWMSRASRISSVVAMLSAPQVGGLHVTAGAHRIRRVRSDDRAVDHHGDASAMRNTASMSCSTSRMAWPAFRWLQQGQHAVGLLGAHAGQRLVQQQHLRARWPGTWRSRAGASGRATAAGLRSSTSARPACCAAWRGGAAGLAALRALPPGPGPLRARLRGQAAVLEHAELGVDGVALVAAAEAGAGAARLRPGRHVLAQQFDRPAEGGISPDRMLISVTCRHRWCRSPRAPAALEVERDVGPRPPGHPSGG